MTERDLLALMIAKGAGGAGGGIPEAPLNGLQFVRQDGEWARIEPFGASPDWAVMRERIVEGNDLFPAMVMANVPAQRGVTIPKDGFYQFEFMCSNFTFREAVMSRNRAGGNYTVCGGETNVVPNARALGMPFQYFIAGDGLRFIVTAADAGEPSWNLATDGGLWYLPSDVDVAGGGATPAVYASDFMAPDFINGVFTVPLGVHGVGYNAVLDKLQMQSSDGYTNVVCDHGQRINGDYRIISNNAFNGRIILREG